MMDAKETATRAWDLRANMIRVALSILRQSSDAEDAISNAVVKACHSAEGLRDEDQFKAWLMRILVRCCYDILRQRNAQPRSAVSGQDYPEKDNGAYTLRVVQADVNLNAATFRLERVFQDEAAIDQFKAHFDRLGPFWGFIFHDENGDMGWCEITAGDHDTEVPVKQEDRTWVWGYTARMANLKRIPKTITMAPFRDDPAIDPLSREFRVAFPDEAIEFSFE